MTDISPLRPSSCPVNTVKCRCPALRLQCKNVTYVGLPTDGGHKAGTIRDSDRRIRCRSCDSRGIQAMIQDRGFASMDRDKQREIASKGGRAAHEKGTAHEWTREEAREAGRKGGLRTHQQRSTPPHAASTPERPDTSTSDDRVAHDDLTWLIW